MASDVEVLKEIRDTLDETDPPEWLRALSSAISALEARGAQPVPGLQVSRISFAQIQAASADELRFYLRQAGASEAALSERVAALESCIADAKMASQLAVAGEGRWRLRLEKMLEALKLKPARPATGPGSKDPYDGFCP